MTAATVRRRARRYVRTTSTASGFSVRRRISGRLHDYEAVGIDEVVVELRKRDTADQLEDLQHWGRPCTMKPTEFTRMRLNVEHGVAAITFNRPEIPNAWAGSTATEYRWALHWCHTRSDVRVVVVSGRTTSA